MNDESDETRSEGLIGSLRRLGRNVLGTLSTRLEIFSTEFHEERLNLVRTTLVVLGVLFCLQAGIFLAVLFVVLSVSDQNRLMAIGIAAAVLLVVALLGALWLWRWLKTRPPLFETTVAELRKDRERLRGDE